jgi:ribosomal protein S18 acetylase RimI-like enzyme
MEAEIRMKYALRPATKDDYEFLYDLKVTCLKDYVAATWGWDEEYQQQRFTSFFDPANIQIIVVNGQDAGQLSVEDMGDELYIAGIYLSPKWQDQGLGTAIIGDLLASAKTLGKQVSLQVLKVNPARQLYERLGFSVFAETDTHFKMRCI